MLEQILHPKHLNYRIERKNEKLLITLCVSKIEVIKTIEIALNFDEKKLVRFLG